MNNSEITCDEVIDVEETNFNGKNITSKTQIFYIQILIFLLLLTIALFIVFSIYRYLMK